jgi:site-specific DNA-methyltransferase (adenine-specific)
MKPYYDKDGIIIYNRDCLKTIDRLKLQGIEFDDIVFVSDPPFNVGYHYEEYEDNLSEGEYYSWLETVFGNYKKVVIHYPEQLYKFAFQIGEFPQRIVSWVYNSNTAKQHRDIAFFGIKPDFKKVGQPYKNPTDKRIAKRIANGKTARLYDWWEINQVKNVSKKHSHPCVMPEKVMENIIGLLPKNMMILDPFMGSGTTLVAACRLKRKAVGIEISEKYCEIAAKRIEKETKQRKLF